MDITGSYTDPSGLNFKIRSPDGPVVDVINRGKICSEGTDFDFSIDDDAPSGFVPCPNDKNCTILPDNPMTVFKDQDAQGTWQFTIFDDGGSGSLTGWKLEICFGASSVTSVRERPEVDAPNVKVFPNPFEEQFNFVLEKEQIESLLIRNLAGQVVYQVLGMNTAQLEVMTNKWLPGFYTYEIIGSSGKHYTGKLVKNN